MSIFPSFKEMRYSLDKFYVHEDVKFKSYLYILGSDSVQDGFGHYGEVLFGV